MKIVVYGAGVMAQYVKESILNTGNEFVGFVDPLGNGDYVTLKNTDVEYVVETKIDGLSIALEYNRRKTCTWCNKG